VRAVPKKRAAKAEAPRLWIVAPVWNQWPMTLAFLESLEAAEPRLDFRLVVVDNGSTDATAEGLKRWSRRLPMEILRNRRNLGVAPAWNQGLRRALKGGASWIGILNNDLLLGPGALSRMRQDAEHEGWQAVSPGTREGALDYDFSAYAASYSASCARWRREGRWFGWCFLVSRRGAETVGAFDEGFRLGIGEDEDYFRRLAAAGLRCGVTGGAFVHHFGSATLGPLRLAQGTDFEESNLKKLRARWGHARPSPLRRWGSILRRCYERLRWGHELKE
jgi:GT2 family glycosyltransferase